MFMLLSLSSLCAPVFLCPSWPLVVVSGSIMRDCYHLNEKDGHETRVGFAHIQNAWVGFCGSLNGVASGNNYDFNPNWPWQLILTRFSSQFCFHHHSMYCILFLMWWRLAAIWWTNWVWFERTRTNTHQNFLRNRSDQVVGLSVKLNTHFNYGNVSHIQNDISLLICKLITPKFPYNQYRHYWIYFDVFFASSFIIPSEKMWISFTVQRIQLDCWKACVN